MSYDDQYDPMDGIAIIGMAGRFPGANSVDELWRNLLEGRESISRFTRDELERAHPEDMDARSDPGYVCARGVLDGVDQFDEAFFGFTPAEAALLDPQQRLFLQTAWEALEHAGHDPARFGAPIGVYAGGTANSYYLNNLQSRRDVTDRLGLLTTQMANQGHYIATRTAYKLDLRGPALNIHTACSTSLVAVCTAVQSLQSFQCDMALAGGVSVTVPQKRGYLHQEGSILSPDGHCRAFDAAAAGTVFSNGLGVVVLRRLQDAIEAGDTIYAVIKGAALNNDGSGKLSFTAPSVDGQAEVVALAQALAGIDPQTISYVEAHGTGTALGDPIEIAGLTQAFRAGGAEGTGFCAIGSLKTNLGHMDAAAGVAGLIKTALALHHRTLPASLHFRTPNPELHLEQTPFFVNDSLRAWPAGTTPRRAGVSSFGVGGTNAHVVLEEAPRREAQRFDSLQPREALLVLSARDDAALQRSRERLLQALQQDDGADWHDLTRTLQEGRRAFGRRAAWVCSGRPQALAALEVPVSPLPEVPEGRVSFLFPGQGAQRVNMGRALYASEPVFRREIDACAQVLLPHLGCDLRDWLYPAPGAEAAAEQQLQQTAFTQPALFCVSWSLAQLVLSWGIQPAGLLGHSVGEWVAATLAGSFERDDALVLVAQRARWMQSLPPGAMLAVRASAEALQPELTPQISIAAVNAPQMTVLSGEVEAMARLSGTLQARDIACRPLATSHAFHSPMMEPILAAFRECVQNTRRSPPVQPWISGLTGRPITDEEAVSPDYWARQLREPVQFAQGLSLLLDRGDALLEIGPGQTLMQLVRRQDRPLASRPLLLASMPRPGAEDERAAVLEAAGQLWCAGLPLDFAAVQPGPWRRVALPTYPFAPNRRWIDPAPAVVPAPDPALTAPRPEPVAASAPVATVPAAAPAMSLSPEVAIPPEPSPVAAAAPVPMSTPSLAPLVSRLQALFADLAGLDATSMSPEAHFLELGLDSLSLTQASQSLHKQFGLKVPMRVLLEECSTVSALAAHLAPQLPPEPVVAAASPSPSPSPAPAPAPKLPIASVGTGDAVPSALLASVSAVPGLAGLPEAASSPWAEVIAQQLALMGRQLELLRQLPAGAALSVPPADTGTAASAPAPKAQAVEAPKPAAVAPQPAAVTAAAPAAVTAFGPYRPPVKALSSGLSEGQTARLHRFIERYNARTPGSKQAAQQHRAHLADPRSVAGFRLAWKELVYPIVSVRSSGSRLWDVDGNAYIDITNGFGMILFGHNPPFVREAVQAQLDAGYEIGPQTPLAGEVAQLLCEMVGMERAAFCGTGSEAVMAAIRTARTVTGRDTIVIFNGAYHGIFDEVLMRPGRGGADAQRPRSLPIAPGIPAAMGENIVVLEYGSPEALRTIEALGPQLAAVLVEPVQSRRPDLQPREFLHELRRITADAGTALVFDEVVTGFRVHPGGAQAWFGVKADIATYGKVLGGGLPIGVVAGQARFLDALDGGAWRYGDDSAPEVGVTFFAGTFVRHPLALAAARAVLQQLKAQGSDLQRGLNLRTARLAEQLRDVAQGLGAPLQVTHFASWFCMTLPGDLPLAPLFFAALRLRGIHAWEGRPCFLTAAHSEADIEAVVDAVREALIEMQQADFLPTASVPERAASSAPSTHDIAASDRPVPPVAGARRGRDRQGREAWFLPDPARPGKYLQIREEGTRHG